MYIYLKKLPAYNIISSEDYNKTLLQ